VNQRLTARILGIGVALGVAGLALFAGLHALLVKPVWSQLLLPIPFVIAIGIGVTWGFHEYVTVVPGRVTAAGGLRFGLMTWVAALPATALANVTRVQHGGTLPVWAGATAIALAAGGGVLVIGGAARTRRAAIAGACTALVLLAAAAGPLPVLRNGRVAELWLGLLVLECAGGLLLAQLYRRWIVPVIPAAP
jgi:hypothetical protein